MSMATALSALIGWQLVQSPTHQQIKMKQSKDDDSENAKPSSHLPPSFDTAAACIFWLTTVIKLLCMPFYLSTDFDVHRNWLAITHSLPMKQWYYESTSEWTLDYPPFFALFELILSIPARLFDRQMLVISMTPYRSPMTIVYQRLTVIIVDIVLYLAIMQFVRIRPTLYETCSEKQRQITLLILCFGNPGLIMLDHIHFQYNGFLLGIFLLSINAILRGQVIRAALYFSILLNLKHIFLYVAPTYFVYLFFAHCVVRTKKHNFPWIHLKNFASLAAVVIAVFGVSLGPFLVWGQGSQLLARLFPFQRGLCHAYWAPNAWVFYNLLDKVLVAAGRKLGVEWIANLPPGTASTSAGRVEDIAHIVLPTIKSAYAFILTIAAMMPALIHLARKPHPRVFLSSLIYCSLCSFMLGWHVHEKAILLTILPLSLCACDSIRDAKTYLFLSIVGHYSLFPLLFRPTGRCCMLCVRRLPPP